jgi:hypothetical protein
MDEKELGPEFAVMRKISDLFKNENCDVRDCIIAMSKLICGYFAVYPEPERCFKGFIEDTERYFKHIMEHIEEHFTKHEIKK